MSRTPDSPPSGPWTRERLAGHPTTVLKDRGEGSPRVVRVDLPEGPVVLKEWRVASSVLVRAWARRVMRREAHNYRVLQGAPGIPCLLGTPGGDSVIIAFIDGQPIHRNMSVALLHPGLDSLETTIAALHARRFVHLDLHQKRNVLVDGQGQAWLIDVGQGLDCSRGLVPRVLFGLLARIDRAAVRKFRARYAPETIDPEHRDAIVARYGGRSVRRWLKPLRRAVRRMLLRDR